MKKIYKKRIIQYDLKGKMLRIFKTGKSASKITSVSYDSIISSCKGKYNTAGGSIFRFEGDPIFKKSSQKGVICQICGAEESIRSFAMHLRWSHKDITNDEYEETYGPYTLRKIKVVTRKKASTIECKLCGEKMMSNNQLMTHITKKHKTTSKEEYIIEHIYGNQPPLCKCGCGGQVTLLLNGNNCDLKKETYHRDYIKGHWDWPVFSNISNQSQEELDLVVFIKSIYKGEIQESVKGLLPKGEIDIYLPDLKIGIEYNGLYWHSERAGRGKHYHLDKTLKAHQAGIRLIHIFSDEWNLKNEIVKNKLRSILGANNSKIYARKCIIQEITDLKEKGKFLDKNHIQGNDRSKVKLGLYYDNNLIGIMTFSSPRLAMGGKPSSRTWELSRYATSANVIGGASKLISFFIKNYKPKLIYSYSDNRWSNLSKNLYTSIGFLFKSRSTPGYYYTKDFKERLHRFNFRKHNLKKMGMNISGKTEKQIMEELKYSKIWDCGVTRWELICIDKQTHEF